MLVEDQTQPRYIEWRGCGLKALGQEAVLPKRRGKG